MLLPWLMLMLTLATIASGSIASGSTKLQSRGINPQDGANPHSDDAAVLQILILCFWVGVLRQVRCMTSAEAPLRAATSRT